MMPCAQGEEKVPRSSNWEANVESWVNSDLGKKGEEREEGRGGEREAFTSDTRSPGKRRRRRKKRWWKNEKVRNSAVAP